jgi:hypothetical protein
MLGWAGCGSHKKRDGSHWAKLVFLHLGGFAGHVVCCSAYGALNIDELFLMLGWSRCGSHKKHVGTYHVELVILHLVQTVSQIVRFGASGA